MSFPILFTINDRPVKVVIKSERGGLIALAINMHTGDWEPADHLYDRFQRHDGEIDDMTPEQFAARVNAIRKRIGLPEVDENEQIAALNTLPP